MQTSVLLRQQVFRPATSQRQARRPLTIVSAAAPDQQQRRDAPILKQLAVGLAAAALLHSAPADAGVIIQKSSLKKVFQSEPVERVKAEASKAADKVADAASGGGGGISLPKVNLPSGGGGPTLSQLTLPLAIGGIGLTALGWRQVDPSFASFFDDAMVKNSNKTGAGYEQLVRSGENMKRSAQKTAKKGTRKFFGKKK
jgi:hypothetical protein